MGIRNRRFTYRGQIKISPSDMSLLKSGKKRCTVRVGIIDVSGTDLYMTDGRQRVKIRISEVDNHRVYRELINQDALDEGFSSLEELQKDLSVYYGKIDPEQPVTIIRFDVVDEQTTSSVDSG
jgi:hypothetical protein